MARIGTSDVTLTAPPIAPEGNVTYFSAPAPSVKVIVVWPGSATLTLAVVAPGLTTWMLSPTIPAEALSNQWKKPCVVASEEL